MCANGKVCKRWNYSRKSWVILSGVDTPIVSDKEIILISKSENVSSITIQVQDSKHRHTDFQMPLKYKRPMFFYS